MGSRAATDGIQVQALGKRFGSVAALDSIGLEVERGEAVALIGRNGAGKSTLLRILATSVLPDAGRAIVAGHDVVEDPDGARRRLGFLFADDRSWYGRLTGRQNLEFFAALYGMRRAPARRRAANLLEEMGLSEAAERAFETYSSGMRLRLSLARAFLSQPAVLLLDEPTRSLDAEGADDFRDQLLRFVREATSAVLLVSHDVDLATALANRIAVMSQGQIQAIRDTDGSGRILRGTDLCRPDQGCAARK